MHNQYEGDAPTMSPPSSFRDGSLRRNLADVSGGAPKLDRPTRRIESLTHEVHRAKNRLMSSLDRTREFCNRMVGAIPTPGTASAKTVNPTHLSEVDALASALGELHSMLDALDHETDRLASI